MVLNATGSNFVALTHSVQMQAKQFSRFVKRAFQNCLLQILATASESIGYYLVAIRMLKYTLSELKGYLSRMVSSLLPTFGLPTAREY